MRTVLSEEAVARRGRVGCGEEDQARVLLGGWRVARGRMVGGMVVLAGSGREEWSDKGARGLGELKED